MNTGIFVSLSAAALLQACTSLEPYRYRLPEAGVTCTEAESARSECRNNVTETTSAYDLHFVEFDDQGLQYPETFEPKSGAFNPAEFARENCELKDHRCLHNRAWAYQINNLIKQLNVAAEKQPITLIVFVHGWNHNARNDDANLAGFRKLLGTAALIEDRLGAHASADAVEADRPRRRVVGVYVGWRGASTEVPGLKQLTFWSRKTAANHVAQGSSRELFARLRGFKCLKNRDGEGRCNQSPTPDDRVKVILIGHSFGGSIVFNAISGSLIESMTRAFDSNDSALEPYWRFANLAVLINPAFEATRYSPLRNIAVNSPAERYETPLLVTVTSTDDKATRLAFRYGRAFNTLFERTADDEEKDANRSTIGHHRPYLTHRLEIPADGRSSCAGWLSPEADQSPEDAVRVLKTNLPIEYENSRDFFRAHGENFGGNAFRLKDEASTVREFCGGVRLTRVADKVNSPIWNVSAVGHRDLLPNHNDIMQPLFVAFFRQLYMDTVFLDQMTANDPGRP